MKMEWKYDQQRVGNKFNMENINIIYNSSMSNIKLRFTKMFNVKKNRLKKIICSEQEK